MAFPRAYHTLTVLPDGNVLVTGGGLTTEGKNVSTAVHEAEMWFPTSGTWQTMAPMSVPRLYHGTALLLSDGRVIAAGSGDSFGGPNQTTAEFYSPPYLFKGVRPSIAAAPSVIQHGSSFTINLADAAPVSSVALVRPAAVTHQFDEGQRYVSLTFQQNGGVLTVTAPANANLAPPGYYMLFVVNTAGAPSAARWVRLPLPLEDTTPPTVTATSPVNGATAVSTGTAVTATFNEGMDASTINASTFELRNSANALVLAAVSYNTATRVATLSPNGALNAAATYTATIRGGTTDPRVRDVAGNALAVNWTWSFTSAGASSDTTPPVVTATSPVNGASGVSVGTNLAATFSEAMDAATINTTTFELRDSANALVPAVVSYNANAATLTPASALNGSGTYTATVRGGSTDPRVKDVAGNALVVNSTWTFTTGGEAPDPTSPAVNVAAPVGGSVVSGTIAVTASASDNQGVVGVRFRVDAADLGIEDTTAPYSQSWDTRTASNGAHVLTAVARDAAGNQTTSSPVSVTVSNTAPPPATGLAAAYAFKEASGTITADTSGNGTTPARCRARPEPRPGGRVRLCPLTV